MSSPSPSSSTLSSIQSECDLIGSGSEEPQPPALLGKTIQGQEVKRIDSSILPEAKDQLIFVTPKASTLNLEAFSISPTKEESSISVALQTLHLFSPEAIPTSSLDTIEQNLQCLSSNIRIRSHKHTHKREKSSSKVKSKRASHTKKISQLDTPSKTSSSPSLNTEELILPNPSQKNGILPQRSLSMPLQPATTEQHLQKHHIKTTGSTSDRPSTSSEIKPLYHLTRPIEGTTESPIPMLTNFISKLDLTELCKLEKRFKRCQRHQLSSSKVQRIPKKNVDTVTNNLSKSIEMQGASPEISIDENTVLTLERIPAVLEKLIQSRKQVSWDSLIQNLINLPDGLDRFLQILCTKIQAQSSRSEEHALAEILTEILLKLKGDELLRHKDTLKQVQSLHVELYILIHIQIEKASYIQNIQEDSNATQLIDMILKKEDPSLIYGHHWITSSRSLATSLYNRLCSCKDPQQLDLLVEATNLLLNMRTVSATVMHQFKKLADQKLAEKDLNQNVFQKLERGYWFAIRPLLSISSISRSNQSVSNKQVVSAISATLQKNWSEIEEKIRNHKFDSDTMERLAQDLTILDADYFNKITPQEFIIWAKQPEKASAIQASISHFNLLSLLVQSQILASSDLKVRTRYCRFFIRLSQRLVEKGNLNSAYSIVAALNASPINRLKQTWLEIKAKYSTEKDKLDELFSSLKHFKNYQAHIQEFLDLNTSSNKTYLIPAVSILLGELRFAADMQTILTAASTDNPSEIGCLNFYKMSALSKVCRQFAQCHQSTCHFFSQSSLDKMYFDIASKLDETKKFQNEDDLWILSNQHEPPLEPIKAKESPEIHDAKESSEAQKSSQSQSEKRKKRLSKNLSGSFRIVSRDTFKQIE